MKGYLLKSDFCGLKKVTRKYSIIILMIKGSFYATGKKEFKFKKFAQQKQFIAQ